MFFSVLKYFFSLVATIAGAKAFQMEIAAQYEQN
jgi:hypothetical protein